MRPAPIGWHINKIQIQPIGCDFRGGGSIVEFRLPGTLLAALQDSPTHPPWGKQWVGGPDNGPNGQHLGTGVGKRPKILLD